jgi:hypothetical protein
MSQLTRPVPLPPPEVVPSPRGRHRRPARGRSVLLTLVITLVVAMVPVGASIGQALGAPGQASTSVRLVEWLRDHGGGGVVDLVENLWYARNRPGSGAPDPASIPVAPATGTTLDPGGAGPPPLPAGDGAALPSEARWNPSVQRVGGRPPLYTAYFRPLSAASVVVGVAWLDQSSTHAQLIAGTQDPARSSGRATGEGAAGKVPVAAQAGLLATFNSGFKLKDAQGGYYAGGREIVPLRPGTASLVIDSSGRVDIGAWGRDVGRSPGMVSVRQNLDLIVDHSSPVPGLDANTANAWGSSNNQFQYTWRSGLGIDVRGNLIYVAADRINLADLAHCLTVAGAVRAMELDMHPQMVTFMTYGPGQVHGAGVGNRLLPSMLPPTDRYLVRSQRDFLAVTAR